MREKQLWPQVVLYTGLLLSSFEDQANSVPSHKSPHGLEQSQKKDPIKMHLNEIVSYMKSCPDMLILKNPALISEGLREKKGEYTSYSHTITIGDTHDEQNITCLYSELKDQDKKIIATSFQILKPAQEDLSGYVVIDHGADGLDNQRSSTGVQEIYSISDQNDDGWIIFSVMKNRSIRESNFIGKLEYSNGSVEIVDAHETAGLSEPSDNIKNILEKYPNYVKKILQFFRNIKGKRNVQ